MIVCEKFVSRGLPLVHIDEKFLFYTNIVERMDTVQPFHDIGPIRVKLHTLIGNIRAYAVDWKNTLGDILIERTRKSLKALHKQMTVHLHAEKSIVNIFSNKINCIFFSHSSFHSSMKELKQNLNRNISGLDEFKHSMQIIATIQSTNISTELQLHEIQETFAILADHKIEVKNYILFEQNKICYSLVLWTIFVILSSSRALWRSFTASIHFRFA